MDLRRRLRGCRAFCRHNAMRRHSSTAIASPSSARTGSSFSKSSSAAPGSAPSPFRSTSLRAGPQLQHILSNCGARLLVMEAAYAENLTMLDPRELAIESIWLIGATADVRIGDIGSRPRCRGAASGSRRAPTQPGDLGADPLYVRHHRPVEGRVLSARAIFLVGRQYGIAAAIARLTMSSARACRCFIPMRSTPSIRRC